MPNNSETVRAISSLIFIGEEEADLGSFDLVLVLGNDEIVDTVEELRMLRDKGHFNDNTLIVFSGATGSLNAGKAPEAERMYDEAVRQGFSPDHILKEPTATNTLLNFRNSRPVIESVKPIDGFQNILVLCKGFLTRRAKMCAAACGYPAEKIHYYGTEDKVRNINRETWYLHPDATERLIKELARIAEYTLKGDLSLD